ncbi:MAG: response regulator [Rhizobacter sp.]|nr:response regulator [Bacteriovorax sp.]
MTQKRRFTILIVDDDPKIRELIQAYFSVRNEEVNCIVASDVQQAGMKLSNQDFDLIIIDNIMPIKMGIDYALFLRRSIKYERVPIILMSGALQQEDVLKAVEGGIKEVLVKPFTLKQLSEKIAPYISKYMQS